MLKDTKTVAYEKLLKLPNALEIDVGILETDASQGHPSGETVGDIAEQHEFGLGVPRRSWLRDGLDEKENILEETNARLLGTIADGAEVLIVGEKIGLFTQGVLQKRFQEGIGPELSQVTIDKKGHDQQLVEKGILRSSISSQAKIK